MFFLKENLFRLEHFDWSRATGRKRSHPIVTQDFELEVRDLTTSHDLESFLTALSSEVEDGAQCYVAVFLTVTEKA